MLSVTIGGITYSLDDGTYCYYLGDDGTGMAPSHRLTSRGSLQDGDTDRGQRLDPRVVRLFLQLVGTSRSDLYTKRQTLIRFLKPGNSPVLKFTPGATTYAIAGYYVGDMGLPSNDREGFSQKLAVSIRCPDPLFYNPTQASLTFSLANDGTSVPTPVPTPVGASTINQQSTITYTGSYHSLPVVRVFGPITDAVITNLTTGEKLDFTGVSIASGDYREIDCTYSIKTVKDSAGAIKNNNLTTDSDLATFHIQEATDGTASLVNTIQVTGSGVSALTNIQLIYYTRYAGI